MVSILCFICYNCVLDVFMKRIKCEKDHTSRSVEDMKISLSNLNLHEAPQFLNVDKMVYSMVMSFRHPTVELPVFHRGHGVLWCVLFLNTQKNNRKLIKWFTLYMYFDS